MAPRARVAGALIGLITSRAQAGPEQIVNANSYTGHDLPATTGAAAAGPEGTARPDIDSLYDRYQNVYGQQPAGREGVQQ